MLSFVQRHREQVRGVLSGFDRLRFRGTLRVLAHVGGMMDFLWHQRVPLKRFKEYACETTKRLREATEAFAERAGQRVRYIHSSALSKEDLVRDMAEREGRQEGLLAVLSCVEPCRSYELHRNRDTKHLDLRNEQLKCLHYYFYFQHPRLGFMHARLQTWFPFTMHVCMNGREWLARQLDHAGVDYLRQDNCFVELSDVKRAQRLFDRQLATDWPRLLDRIARQVFPLRKEILGNYPVPYYWSADQSEWATDVMFDSRSALAALYPRLVLHGMTHLGTRDVLRFLGRKAGVSGRFGRLTAEVKSDLRQRMEGTRLKHFINQNSIKMYDKQGRVLRIETTINSPREMKTYRPKEGDEGGPKSWRYLRKGVADMARRAEISQAANQRYLKSLATVDETTPLEQLVKGVCRPVHWKGHRVRALNPLAKHDAALLAAVNRGEFLLHGFRNRDLVPLLYSSARVSVKEQRRRSSRITRQLRMLRAHGLIKKVPRTHRYQLTEHGRTIITALLAAQQANTSQLLKAA
jgi:hypothetical protein